MAAKKKNADLWKGGIVPYTIDSDVARVDLINEAISFFETNTNVRFVRRHDHEEDFVRFQLDANPPFVSSKIGRDGGEQTISISDVRVNTYCHEIGHALGMIHEQQRSDRDDHIIIHFDKIPDDDEDQYVKRDSVNSAVYDFSSIMHYPAISNDEVVMEAIDGVPPPQQIHFVNLPTPIDSDFLNQIYPAPGVIRRSSGERGAGGVSEVSAVVRTTASNQAQIVTAVRNDNGNLQLIKWSVDEFGGVLRSQDPKLDHGKATSIGLTRIGGHLVGCMRDADGDLRLISWTNQLVKEADSGDLAGETSMVRILPLSLDSFLTACIDGNGRLKLITWRIDAQGGFERVADSGAAGPGVKTVSIVRVNGDFTNPIVAVACQTTKRVQVFLYVVSLAVLNIDRAADTGTKIGKGTMVDCAAFSAGLIAVGCADANGNLKLIPLEVTRDGQVITRLSPDATAGTIKNLRMLTRPYGLLTAVSSAANRLVLIKWELGPNGQLTRLGDSGDEAGVLNSQPLIDVVTLPIDRTTICTPVRNASGDLLLITWDDSNGPGELIR